MGLQKELDMTQRLNNNNSKTWEPSIPSNMAFSHNAWYLPAKQQGSPFSQCLDETPRPGSIDVGGDHGQQS